MNNKMIFTIVILSLAASLWWGHQLSKQNVEFQHSAALSAQKIDDLEQQVLAMSQTLHQLKKSGEELDGKCIERLIDKSEGSVLKFWQDLLDNTESKLDQLENDLEQLLEPEPNRADGSHRI